MKSSVKKFKESYIALLTVLFLAALALPINSYGQAPLTNESILKLAKAGMAEDVIIGMVNLHPGQYSLTPDDLISLKKDGVSDKIIAAMIGMGQSSPSAKPVPSAGSTVSTPTDATAALDTGVYFKRKDEWVEVLPEVVNWKTGGFLKSVASGGLLKGDVNGNIKGGQSRNRATIPLEFLVKAPEGVAITEYQLIRLHESKNEREFRTVTGGVLHASGGVTRDLIDFEGKRIANRTFTVVLPENIGAGEYGFLPPGAFTSASSASIGKMYTFRVVE